VNKKTYTQWSKFDVGTYTKKKNIDQLFFCSSALQRTIFEKYFFGKKKPLVIGHGGEPGDFSFESYILDDIDFVSALISFLEETDKSITIYLPHSISLLWVRAFFEPKVKEIIYITEGSLTFEYLEVGHLVCGKRFSLALSIFFKTIYSLAAVRKKKSRELICKIFYTVWHRLYRRKNSTSSGSYPLLWGRSGLLSYCSVSPYTITKKSFALIADRTFINGNKSGLFIRNVSLGIDYRSILVQDLLNSAVIFYDRRLEVLDWNQQLEFFGSLGIKSLTIRCRTIAQEFRLRKRLKALPKRYGFLQIDLFERQTKEDVTVEAIYRGCEYFIAHDASTCQWMIRFFSDVAKGIKFESFIVCEKKIFFPHQNYNPEKLKDFFPQGRAY